MRRIRQHERAHNDLYPLTKRHGVALLPSLRVYARDADPEIAIEATRSLSFQLKDARSLADRRKVVDCLTEMLKEGYETGRRWGVGHTMLVYGRATDFTTVAKQILRDVLTDALGGTYKHPGHVQEILLLIGVADARSELPRLGELVGRWDEEYKLSYQRERDQWREEVAKYGDTMRPRLRLSEEERLRKATYWQNSFLWDALRVRARMGVKEDIRRCIEMAESHPDPDYRAAYLFGQLAYIRQPEIIEYLAPYLDSDKRPPSGGSDTIVMSYAAHAASAIAAMLENAPIKSYQTNPEQIAMLRQWLGEQTDWKITR